MSALIVQGAKKGGGGGRAPIEAKDTLRSKQWAEVLDLVSEGEIAGLVAGLQSVFLDGVPVENADGSRNFTIDSFVSRVGTQGQTAITGFDTAQSEVAVGIRVKAGIPVVRSIPAGVANRVRVTVGVPELSEQSTTTGDMSGSSVTYAIDIQTAAGGFVERWSRTIEGKTTTRYQAAVLIDLQGAGPWDIRMRRLTADSTSVTLRNECWFDSYTLINTANLRYPNSALCGLRVDAEHHSRIPTRSYHLRGRILQVPSNYNPTTRSYTGTWDGTFRLAYSNNPAWVYFDLATHTRYGLGRRIAASKFSKWELYTIGRYCDAVNAAGQFVGVPDGRGGMEPRFTANLYLQRPEEAYKVLQDMAAIFRGMLSYGGSAFQVQQDAPSDAYSLFTSANVVEGSFRYEGSSRGVKKSGCVVWWNNPENQYKLEPEFVSDPDLIAKYGVENMELSPIGCCSRGQAIRLGKWALYTEANEGETVSFSVGSIGAAVPLGRVFQIADPSVSGEQLGGLVKTATATQVTLDREVTLRAGESYTLHVMVPDTAQVMGLRSMSRPVVNAAGNTTLVTLSSALDMVPPDQSVWVLESSAVAPTSWRCIRIAEGKTPGTYDIGGVAHQPGKFDLIELGIAFDEKPVSRMREDAPVATGLALRETVYRVAGVAYSRVTIGWVPTAPALHYRVSWRLSAGPWTAMPLTGGQSVDLDNMTPGLLEVSIRTVNPLGVEGGATLDGTLLVAGDARTPWGGESGNLIPNSEFASGSTAGWVLAPWIAGQPLAYAGTERARDASGEWIPPGCEAIALVQWVGVPGGNDQTVVGGAFTEKFISVEAGEWLCTSGWLAAHRCLVGMVVEYQSAAGTQVPGGGWVWLPAAYVDRGGTSLDLWKRIDVVTQAPTNAATMRVVFVKGNTFAGASSSYGWMLHPQIARIANEYSELPPYTPGSPTSTRQIGYVGDLDATLGAPAGTKVGTKLAEDVARELNDMADDGKLTPLEKGVAVPDWLAFSAERPGLLAEADRYGITAERATYDAEVNNLASYLNGLSPPWSDTTTTTTIDPAAWRARWVAVQVSRQALQNRIAALTWQSLDDIASDGKLTPLEKSQAITAWHGIDGERAGLLAEAGRYGAAAEGGAYDAAYVSLANYLTSLSPPWSDTTTTTTIDPAAWRARWVAVQVSRQALQNRISELTKRDLNDIADDGKLTPLEKSSAILEWQSLSGGRPGLLDEASRYGISIERSSFDAEVNNLANYLVGLVPGWSDTATTTPIDPATWRARWVAARMAREALQNRITAVTKQGLDDALSRIGEISSDSMLTGTEKSALIISWREVDEGLPLMVAQADALSIVPERDAALAAKSALWAYLTALSPPWNDPTTTTPIDAAVFRDRWAVVYNTRNALGMRIAEETSKRATWSAVSGAGKPEDGATVGASFGVNVGGAITELSAADYVASRALHEGLAARTYSAISCSPTGTVLTGGVVRALAGGMVSVIAVGSMLVTSGNSTPNIASLALRSGGTVLAAGNTISVTGGTLRGLSIVMWAGQISGEFPIDLVGYGGGTAEAGATFQCSVFKR